MKRKRLISNTQNLPNDPQTSQQSSQPPQTNVEVIDVDDDPIETNNSASSSSLKQSWVWNHFQDSSNPSGVRGGLPSNDQELQMQYSYQERLFG